MPESAPVGVAPRLQGWRGPLQRDTALLITLVERQLRLWAKRSWVGMAWPLVTPLVLLVLYTFVFRGVFRFHLLRYPQFLFAGLVPWTMLAQGLTNSVQSLSQDSDLIRRSRFRLELLPLASVLATSVFTLCVLVVFIVYLAATGRLVYSALPELIPALLSLYLFVGGLSTVLALLDIFNRDMRYVLGSVLTVWFFLLPIVYPQSMLGAGLSVLKSFDPMSLIIGEFRYALAEGRIVHPLHVVEVLLLALVFFAACLTFFRRFAAQVPKVI